MTTWMSAWWACPLCKEILSGLHARLAEGYAWSIVLLLAMPAIIIGLITWRVVTAARRRKGAS